MKCEGFDCESDGVTDHSPECNAEHECSYNGVDPVEVVVAAAAMLCITTDELISKVAENKTN